MVYFSSLQSFLGSIKRILRYWCCVPIRKLLLAMSETISDQLTNIFTCGPRDNGVHSPDVAQGIARLHFAACNLRCGANCLPFSAVDILARSKLVIKTFDMNLTYHAPLSTPHPDVLKFPHHRLRPLVALLVRVKNILKLLLCLWMRAEESPLQDV